jgi:hypothetical protein
MSAPFIPATVHCRRLREIWRSAGWPCQDLVEVELLAAGLLERVRDGHGRETLRVTDAGIRVLARRCRRTAPRARRTRRWSSGSRSRCSGPGAWSGAA